MSGRLSTYHRVFERLQVLSSTQMSREIRDGRGNPTTQRNARTERMCRNAGATARIRDSGEYEDRNDGIDGATDTHTASADGRSQRPVMGW